MRVLCLVNDSDPPVEAWRETYDSHRRFWHRCLDACSASVDGFLIRSDQNLATDWTLDRDSRLFTVRGREHFSTILRKLVRALDRLLAVDHDYVVYTGLSSLYDFPLVLREPVRTGVYSGHLVEGTYVSGAGTLFSNDVARVLVAAGDRPNEWQDVAIQQILNQAGVRPEHREMFIFDYSKSLDQIQTGTHLCYRFRDYDDPHRAREREVMAAVFEKLYGATSC